MSTQKMFRQGDVLIVSTEATKTLGKEIPMEKMGPVLAWGEVTGHHHTVVAHPETYVPQKDLPEYHPVDHVMSLRDWAEDILSKIDLKAKVEGPAARLYEDSPTHRRLVVERETLLRHEEHPAIALAPGHYKIIQQSEYSPAGWQRVQD